MAITSADDRGASRLVPLPVGPGARFREHRQRLEALFVSVAAEVERERRRHPEPRDAGTGAVLGTAERYLEEAEAALVHHRYESAWTLVLEARNALVPLLDGDQREVLALAVREEIADKLTGWRRRSASAVLGEGSRPSSGRLVAALGQIEAGYAATRRRHRTRRLELSILTTWLVLTLVAAGAITVAGWTGDAAEPLTSGYVALLAPVLGILGAALSAIKRVADRAPDRVPAERAAALSSALRPMTGAATGVVVLAAAQADLVSGGGVLLAAFASGFSERFILRYLGELDAEPEVGHGEEGDRVEEDGRGGGTVQEAPLRGGDGPGAPSAAGPANYFRAGVGVIVADDDGRVLAFERRDGDGQWQLPQGGIDAGEEVAAAAWRELAEETGLGPDEVEFVDEYDGWLAYQLPPASASPKHGLGQVQRWFLARVRDDGVDPADLRPTDELVRARWMPFAELIEETAPFRRPTYRTLQAWLERTRS
jgi:putative (di)nucleoside polyphosphate hydrolase